MFFGNTQPRVVEELSNCFGCSQKEQDSNSDSDSDSDADPYASGTKHYTKHDMVKSKVI